MRAYILSHGTLTLDQQDVFGRVLDETNLAKLPVWSLLIDHEDGLILFDTGINTYDWPLVDPRYRNKKNRIFEETWDDHILRRMEQLGYNPADVKHVILSHLHHDHDGNIYSFPNAKIWASAKEFNGLMRAYGTGTARPVSINKIAYWATHPLNWNLVEEDCCQLAAGIKIHQYGRGHHFGMLCLEVGFKQYGPVFLTSDAIYTKTNAGPPIETPELVLDREGYQETVKKILRYTSENHLEVWYGHDSDLFENRLIKSTEGYYE